MSAGTRVASVLAAVVAGAVLAWVVARLVWWIVAPAPAHVLPAVPADPAGELAAAHLFGRAPAAPAAAAPTGSDALGDIRLLGVLASAGGTGQALFRVSAGPVFAHIGDEIVPGVSLRSVEADAVTVRDAAGDHRLALAARGAGRPSPSAGPARTAAAAASPAARAPSSATNVASAGAAACQPPAGFRGEVVRLNVELVGGLIAQPDIWRSMVVPGQGALTVRETAGFAQMVGLQQGDRIEQANGIALTTPDDIVGAVLRPLAANQPVLLVGQRGGQRREVFVLNASCNH